MKSARILNSPYLSPFYGTVNILQLSQNKERGSDEWKIIKAPQAIMQIPIEVIL